MPRSSSRKKKPLRARPAQPQMRDWLPQWPDAADGDQPLAEDDVTFTDDDLDAEDDGPGAEDDLEPASSAAVVRGRVSTATSRRGRVPYLLREVIEARVEVARAERNLEKKVRNVRAHGATWDELGLALGMSRQGVAKRYG